MASCRGTKLTLSISKCSTNRFTRDLDGPFCLSLNCVSHHPVTGFGDRVEEDCETLFVVRLLVWWKERRVYVLWFFGPPPQRQPVHCFKRESTCCCIDW